MALTLADHVCLAVVAEGPTHGWSIVRLLRPDGDLGRIWSLSRPLTYRSIGTLTDQGLVRRTVDGRRVLLRVTRRGRSVNDAWLDEPVEHLRDLRTHFLVKIRLAERSGRSPTELARRQLDELDDTIQALISSPAADPVERWRQESARAADRFLRSLTSERA